MATHLANNHPTTVMIDGGAVVQRIVGDSTAERQPLAQAKFRGLADLSTTPLTIPDLTKIQKPSAREAHRIQKPSALKTQTHMAITAQYPVV